MEKNQGEYNISPWVSKNTPEQWYLGPISEVNEIREDQEICGDLKAEVPHFLIWSWVSNVV